MPQLLMPRKLIYGKNSINKIFPERHEHSLIITDGGFIESRGFLHSIESRIKRISARVSTLVNENVHELYRLASEVYFSEEADCVIAVGSAAVIDCGMILCSESGAEFIAVPVSAACAMTDFETGKYFDYRYSPDCVILDPALMNCIGSDSIAYDGLACFAYALDAVCETENALICSLAVESAAEILKSLIPAFRGNMESLERLMYAMYIAVAAHRNTLSADKSLITKVSEFFGTFGYSKPSVCAVCIPSVAEYMSDVLSDELAAIAGQADISRTQDTKSEAAAKLLDEIRSVQASLSVPRSISGFSLGSDDYNQRKSDSNVPTDLLDLCYFGSFKFAKL